MYIYIYVFFIQFLKCNVPPILMFSQFPCYLCTSICYVDYPVVYTSRTASHSPYISGFIAVGLDFSSFNH